VPRDPAREQRTNDGSRFTEETCVRNEHEFAEDALEEVPVPLDGASQNGSELVRAVVELDVVDDLDALGALGPRLQSDELARRRDMHALEIEIAVR
jgi:hypothetical protein